MQLGKIVKSFGVAKGQDKTTSETVRVGRGGDARARVGLGYTKGLQNYCSARFDVTVELPCSPKKVEETCTVAERIATKHLERMVEDFEKGMS